MWKILIFTNRALWAGDYPFGFLCTVWIAQGDRPTYVQEMENIYNGVEIPNNIITRSKWILLYYHISLSKYIWKENSFI